MPEGQKVSSIPTTSPDRRKVDPIQSEADAKKSSPAVATTQDWTAEQLARAPKLTKSRLAKVRQLVIG
jgi:hypothetical protein